MELHKLTHHCWYSNSEPLTDRPSLGYILSDSGKSIVVDAGNSPAHYNEFLSCLDRNGFPYPSLCVITHSHWDHTLGISKVRVPVIACALTQLHLAEMKSWTDQDLKEFYDSDSCVREEYPTLDMISPSIASVVFKKELTLNLCGLEIQLKHVEGPHSDDSVLVYIPEDGLIFAGDSSAGDFSTPNISYDPILLEKYTNTIKAMDFSCFLHSHRLPLNRSETLAFLAEAKERGYYTF